MTQNKEDYLKALYNNGGIHTNVPNSELAKQLNVSPASVTEMLGKIKSEGLISTEPYKGSKLTDDGIQVAAAIVRGHRLWEVFLIRCLGYSWSEAHEEAELLEHITPSRLVNRLDQFLDFPAYCPHGSAIPHSDGSIENLSLVPLSELQAGEKAIVKRIVEEKKLLDYLEMKGLKLENMITVISIGEYEGLLTIKMGDNEIQVSHKAACQIFVSTTH